MSAGTKIVELRSVVRAALPYLAHKHNCESNIRVLGPHACSCGAADVFRQMERISSADPARTGGPS